MGQKGARAGYIFIMRVVPGKACLTQSHCNNIRAAAC